MEGKDTLARAMTRGMVTWVARGRGGSTGTGCPRYLRSKTVSKWTMRERSCPVAEIAISKGEVKSRSASAHEVQSTERQMVGGSE